MLSLRKSGNVKIKESALRWIRSKNRTQIILLEIQHFWFCFDDESSGMKVKTFVGYTFRKEHLEQRYCEFVGLHSFSFVQVLNEWFG